MTNDVAVELPATGPQPGPPVSAELLHRMDAYWRTANYLSVGQLYLYDNPLLKRPLALSEVKPLVVGHWGTTPGHGGPALVAITYLEGSYSVVYPNVSQDEAGMTKLFVQFSFPGGISSPVAPTTTGLVVACVVGDGEAKTGPLATSWQSTKFLNPVNDGAVLPILHLNGYKISNSTLLARIEHEELDAFLRGCGWDPGYVEGSDWQAMLKLMAGVLDEAIEDIHTIQTDARDDGSTTTPRWPMIVLRSPRGWTGPKTVDGVQVEGTFRAQQVPLLVDDAHPRHVGQLEEWMRSYKPEEPFDADWLLLPDLRMPDFRTQAVAVSAPGADEAKDTAVLGEILRDVVQMNGEWRNFRIFGPGKTLSTQLGAAGDYLKQEMTKKHIAHNLYINQHGQDLPEIRNWIWDPSGARHVN